MTGGQKYNSENKRGDNNCPPSDFWEIKKPEFYNSDFLGNIKNL
jgi:hypothetical protein